jgi:AcrR family transcriptional regulator
MQDQKTDGRILTIARAILASDGLDGVSFDAIARRLGRSKQAVLYWYPTKRDLLLALFVPWLDAEAAAAEAAVSTIASRPEAIDRFVRTIISFHTENLDRFRMMYLAPQTTGTKPGERDPAVTGHEIYSITDRLYGALAPHLGGSGKTARQQAVAIHSAALGMVMMLALAESLRDPLKHSENELVDALVASLTASE